MSVDGTDCRIFEPTPFSANWYSHKFHGAGVRYEVGVCINSDRICWVYGPFPCGAYPDQRIFVERLSAMLLNNEKVIADGGYAGECIMKPSESSRERFQYLRARHEALNGRLKSFSVLRNVFRHDRDLHGLCFHAVAQLVQLRLIYRERLFW